MKQERKESLLRSFPAAPEKFMARMKESKGADNFAIFLTHGNELYARCFHRYYNGKLIERQRYVFAKDGCCRYGSGDGIDFTIRKEFREPVFCLSGYGYSFNNTYTALNLEAIEKSCMKYSYAKTYGNPLLMEYLKLYCKHPNIEYLVKSGYSGVIQKNEASGWYGKSKLTLSVIRFVNFKSNNLLKMLGLNREEFKLLKGQEEKYELYCNWREKYPKLKPEELLDVVKAFNWNFNSADLSEITGIRLPRLATYLSSNNIHIYDYHDYLEQCEELEYNLHDTAICMPHDFSTMHLRLSQIIQYKQSEEQRKLFAENYPARKCLEYSSGDYFIRQPESMDEIVDEGAKLEHCVGGYAERHVEGKLHILFIRRAEEPDKPLYTMELSTSGKIVQVRGLRNCAPTDDVKAFVGEYERHIADIFRKTNKKARKTA